MAYALAFCGFCLVAAVAVHHAGRLARRRTTLAFEQQLQAAEQLAKDKRWADEKAETLAKYDALRSQVEKLDNDLKRALDGREVLRRAS